MNEDQEIERDDTLLESSPYSSTYKSIKTRGNKSLYILLGILLILIFIGGITYFLKKGLTEGETPQWQTNMNHLELKIADLERQITELQSKIPSSVIDPDLLQRLEGLSKRVEALEKIKTPPVESKVKPPPPKKLAPTKKQYHRVQRGETLYTISKKYGISIDELQKLNHLSKGQPLHVGQKLLISK